MKLPAALLLSCTGFLALSSSPSAADQWQVTEERSPVDDSQSVYLALPSTEPFQDRFGRDKWGSLHIDCVENSTSIFIRAGGEFLAAHEDFGYVTLRIDKQRAEQKFMSATTDHECLGLAHGLGIDLIKQIAAGKKLFVRLTPFNKSPVDMVFRVDGLAKHLPKVQKACGWE